MRYSDILVEYDRSKMALALGNNLLTAATVDQTLGIDPRVLRAITANLETEPAAPGRPPQGQVDVESLKQEIVNQILMKFESLLPQEVSKQYTQWLIRLYANEKGAFKFEDVISSVLPELNSFISLMQNTSDLNLVQNVLGPTIKNLNQFKKFSEFLKVSKEIKTILRSAETQNVSGSVLKDVTSDPVLASWLSGYSKGNMGNFRDLTPPGTSWKIVEVLDQTAASVFGGHVDPKGGNDDTRWCTRGGPYGQYGASYLAKGPLYVIIPIPTAHPMERYQFHFQDQQYMNEDDEPIGEKGMLGLIKRCPQMQTALAPVVKKGFLSDPIARLLLTPEDLDNLMRTAGDIVMETAARIEKFKSASADSIVSRFARDNTQRKQLSSLVEQFIVEVFNKSIVKNLKEISFVSFDELESKYGEAVSDSDKKKIERIGQQLSDVSSAIHQNEKVLLKTPAAKEIMDLTSSEPTTFKHFVVYQVARFIMVQMIWAGSDIIRRQSQGRRQFESRINERFRSQQQAKLMHAVANDPKVARRTGIKPSVAKEFIKKSHGQTVSKLPKKVKQG
jgi:hypothetical protein